MKSFGSVTSFFVSAPPLLLASLLFLAPTASASPIACSLVGPGQVAGSTGDVLVTSYKQFNESGGFLPEETFDPGLAARACAGGFANNDMPKPTINLGFAGDGLLNGAAQSAPPGPVIFEGGAFNEFYEYTDLSGNGIADDPGWIMVGRTADNSNVFEPEKVGGIEGIILASFFSFAEDTDDEGEGLGRGTWSITPDAAVVDRLQNAFGDKFLERFFDGFALVFKGGNQFVAYYFDLVSLQIDPATVGAGLMPYNFFGTFDVSKALQNKAISHISLWARDPAITSEIPEPGVAGLFGLGLIALFLRRRLRAR